MKLLEANVLRNLNKADDKNFQMDGSKGLSTASWDAIYYFTF